jgi:hypothetical protein
MLCPASHGVWRGGFTAAAFAAERRLRRVQQVLVVLHALRRSPPDNRRQGAPLAGVQLGEVEELLFFFPRPLGLLDGRVEPLVPPRLALLRRLAVQQRRLEKDERSEWVLKK